MAGRIPRTALRWLAAAAALCVPAGSSAQYFGRNKVNYDDFEFRVLATEHFDIHYYGPDTRAAVEDFGRMAERWYERLARILQHEFAARKPIIVYHNQADFLQTNAIPGFLSQATGGVTESVKNRVILPFAESLRETDHVLGHELVHAFQYDIAQASNGGGQTAIGLLPLWFVEGMAEYLSLGRESSHTAMWMRDAVLRDDLPDLTDLQNPQEFFPYRFGHALWAYIGGVWGDLVVGSVYRAAARRGLRPGIATVLQIEPDTLVANWHRATRAHFRPTDRMSPEQAGKVLLGSGEEVATNLAPTIAPDGRHLAVLSNQGPFSIDLFIVDATTGEVEGRLASANSDPHFEALAYVNSSGAWSPDGTEFAFVTYSQGRNEIAVADVDSRTVQRTYQVADVGAVFGLAWSPDGSRIAFSGSRRGITDLYLLDLESERVEALTNDRYAEWRPSWSPDGTRLVFATDRGGATDLGTLSFDEPGVGILDLRSRDLSVQRFVDAKHVDPTFSPDGRFLYFVSDVDGFSDVYRAELATGNVVRITSVATGVSGLTEMSPAMSVAAGSGTLAFSVFQDGGYLVVTREPTAESPVAAAPPSSSADDAALLPPPRPRVASLLADVLQDARTGLPIDPRWEDEEFDSRLRLDYIAQPMVGLGVDRFGTTVGGSVAAFFSDMLGDRQVGVGLSANGAIQDIGVEAIYLDRGSRLNWALQAARVPYRTGSARVGPAGVGSPSARVVELLVSRTVSSRASLLLQYPFSQTERLEATVGGTHLGFDREIVRELVVGGSVVDREELDTEDPSSIGLGTASLAFVQDNSILGFTSPVDGGRTRLEAGANAGTLDYFTALADSRLYVFLEPLTFAFRALHFGRYGSSAEDPRLSPIYVGQGVLVRGYTIGSFDGDECTPLPDAAEACPEFERLIGSRIAVANAELRIPLLGTEQFGLVPFPYLPTELAFFADAGVAWTSDASPTLEFERRTVERVPVVSLGASARVNLLGRLVLEFYYARPLQRPDAGWQFGFQMSPGW